MSEGMPTMPSAEEIKPQGEETVSKDASASVEEVSKAPEQRYSTPDANTSSEVAIPLTPRSGIKVIATRKGFYGQMRLELGDKFVVRKFEELGSWMKCEDPALERQRVELFKKKKAKK